MAQLPRLTSSLPKLPGAEALTRVLRRWRGEMLDCLPPQARLWLGKRRPVLVIVPVGDDADALLELLGERQSIGGIDLRTPGPPSTAVKAPKQGWAEIRIELPAAAVLLRRVRLPMQVRDTLRQVLAYEMNRLTPFDVGDVYYDVRMAGTASRGTMLEAELALCRRDVVGDWLERMREAATPASRLTWIGAWPDANLLPPEERPRLRRFGSWVTMLLALCVLLLLAAVLVTPLQQKAREQDLLERELRKVRIAAEDVQTVRDELERARLGSVEVLQRMREQPRMTDLLRDLTDILPDGTWVQTLNYNNGEVDIRGESTQATALIGLLEQGAGISDVTFRSPVMQVGGTGQERFHIALKYSRAADAP